MENKVTENDMVGTVQDRVTELNNNTKKKVETKTYDYAHLVMYCGACGTKSILEENVPKTSGVQINLPPTNTAEVMLVCKECGNRMGMFYVESTKKDEKPVTEDNESTTKETIESVQEDGITEAELV